MAVSFTRREVPKMPGNLGLGSSWLKGQAAAGVSPGGQPRLDTPKAYRCEKCGAEPGQPCRRWVGAKVHGRDIGGGYWRTLKTMHSGRRPRDAGVPD